jgi:lysyl-tRNA synthetase class 2
MWQPSASIQVLKSRAQIIARIREFFLQRDVLEVETPLLSHGTVTDPYVYGIPVISDKKILFLQTSPEYAMKRLLAAGSGSIFQISKAFRQDDNGKLHNPEFTMLEWYRVGFDHHQLMDEMDALLQLILQCEIAERVTCKELYEKYAGVNPHAATVDELSRCANEKIQLAAEISDRNTWLELLFMHCIAPNIGHDRPLFLYDFPVSQAALAKIRNEKPPVASRFEVYFKGIELANGFHELSDAKEQRNRFEKDLALRAHQGLSKVPIDENFLAALQQGLPDCAGVALGVDRLVMLALGKKSLAEVISFSFERA